MDESPDHPDATIFDARLTPHRSLTPRAFRFLMIGTFLATATISLPFYLLGAWPIVGFFGLDVLGLYLALRMNFRAARAYEHFLLTYFELRFARVSAAGARREWRFAPNWVRLERVDDEEYGPQRLSLHCRGQRWDIARYVGPDQKADFANRFARALALARRGPRYSD